MCLVSEVSEVLNIEPVCEDISPTPAILKHDDLVTIQEGMFKLPAS